MQMNELFAMLLSYARGIWRHRWVALGIAWAVAVAGWVAVAKIPDRFEAQARVFVDTQSLLRPLLSGLAVQPDLTQRVALMSKMLLNRPTLERVMRMADMDLAFTTEAEKEQLLTDLGKKVTLRADRRNPSLYSVAFEHRDPFIAKRVVQSLVDIFIEEALTDDRRDSASAQQFIDDEIQEYEARLRVQEGQLADFKRRNIGLMTGDGRGYYERLQIEKEELAEAELMLREAIQRRDEFEFQLEEEQAVFDPAADAGYAQVEDPAIQSLQMRLDLLLLQYTERHPDVIELKRLIGELRSRNAGRTGQSSGQRGLSVEANPVFGNMRIALSEAEAQVAGMRSRVDAYKKRVQDLEAKIDQIPSVEAELKELNRDYATLSNQYAELLERKESARLSEQVEKTADGVKLRVIDPPFVPANPSAPNRSLFNAVVFAFALGVGLGAALLVELVRPVFDDGRTLSRVTGIPVLGTVTLIRSPSNVMKERFALLPFIALTFGLFAVFFLVAIQSSGVLKL